MGDKNHRQLVIDALTMAIWRRGKARDVIVHSDQGSTYASFDYRQFLKDSGLIGSVSRKGECLDNAMAESFFGTLKTEWVDDEDYRTKQVCLNTLRYFTIDSADILIWAI
jgi:putative transposase